MEMSTVGFLELSGEVEWISHRLVAMVFAN
jgi:hypothetical protein